MAMPIAPTDLGLAAAEGALGVERARAAPTASAAGPGQPGFADTLVDAIDQARALEGASTDASVRFAAGDPEIGIHEVVLASEKAGIALRYATTLKNKVVEAYRELMATQV
ncbi:MAG: flagellar hook-basal body complex protein FliE [Kofleriaceae bacterium]|jgi:flagellar hook-basal body complex protein FliE|nr:flagellar hook-basal body complex protein FliE [Kofleriaceae bacterium]MBP6839143.1 flagellar hook-basal body complex protein FliE [Kofleriaceae bacterium]MBP9204795.1 flagellar hook-basal body complex protein FliE [Kofleriaceae bacterium]